MMRYFFLLIFIFVSLDAKESINKQIKNTNTKISSFSKIYSSINQKMAKNAKAILKQKKEILQQQKYLEKLQSELKEKELIYKSNTSQLQELKKNQKTLSKVQEKIEEELVFTIAQSVSISIILDEEQRVDSDSLIEFEVLKQMLKASKERANKLNKKYYRNSKDIDLLNINASSLEVAISNIDRKKKSLQTTQKKNKKALKKLKVTKLSYKKALKKILKKQDTLKKTLAKLKIIKIDEVKRAKEEEARRKAFKSRKIASAKDLPKVKRHGSSYQVVKTKKYRGSKTIAPLDSYTITKKYGTYTDPIYGIKIFNESISLRPKKANAKVKTVFNGKVIYADKTAVLDNIVIVEHKNGLHTIYANLSQISPNIKKGKKIKRGYTIGRVSDELIFEVTQKSYHINPIRLFR
ncbi:MAG: peptidoglycan DD-metalloendopeptidase family protein [Campylobacterota bacterium]|nr:peptidoglycan DD-metalloendopeptidase family protein [Campylobacterota bacterium]